MNVILVSVDSLRLDHMSLFGYTRPTTPNLDAWARDGLYFRSYFSSAFLTPISEASVHTGRYPVANGVINPQTSVHSSVPMLAEILKGSGYRTGAFGSSPEFLTHEALRNSFGRGFDVFRMGRRHLLDWRRPFEWVRQGNGPFFLWVPLGNLHWPYGGWATPHFTDPSYRGPLFGVLGRPRYGKAIEVLPLELLSHVYEGRFHPYTDETQVGLHDINGREVSEFSDFYRRTDRPLPLAAADLQHVVDRYDDGLRVGDELLGRLFQWLRDTGLDRSTIVVIQSEHGEDLGDHGYVAHYDILDTTVHTPLIIHHPGLSRKGAVDGMVSGVDVMPTLLDMLGIAAPPVNGRSILAYLNGSVPEPRDAVYLTRSPLWERIMTTPRAPAFYERFRALDDREPQYDTAIRTRDVKLVHRRARATEAEYSWYRRLGAHPAARPEYELYRLDRDAMELSPEAWKPSEDASSPVARLLRQLSEWEQQMAREAVPVTRVPEKTQPYF